MDWSIRKKIIHTAIPCLFAFLITFGTSVSGPALPSLMADFNISQTTAVLSTTVYTEGLAVGPLLFAPLSEIYGRRWVYIGASTCLLAFGAGAGAARTFVTFLVCRFCKKRGAALLIFLLVSFLAPCVAPITASYALHAHHEDWRWTQWLILMAGLPIWLLTLSMQETGEAGLKDQKGPRRRALLIRSFSLPFRLIYSDTITLLLSIHTAFAYGVVFSFLMSFKYILTSQYHFDSQEASMSYLSLVLGYVLAIALCVLMERISGATDCPEKALYGSIAGGILLLLGEIWYALAARLEARWSVLVAAGISVGSGAFALFTCPLANNPSAVIAANGAFRYTFGAVFPLFTVQMYERLGTAWASSVFAFLSLVFVPIPLVLCKYGGRLRRSLTVTQPPKAIEGSEEPI
ncbi:major facilitator superfamily domain-containing protein [Aspergillus navahoensis]